jgi:hypothetical protein
MGWLFLSGLPRYRGFPVLLRDQVAAGSFELTGGHQPQILAGIRPLRYSLSS